MALRAASLPNSYAPMLKWKATSSEMAADYAFNWSQKNQPEGTISFPETNVASASKAYATFKKSVSVSELNEDIIGKLLKFEVQLAREREVSIECVGLTIDAYFRPSSLMNLALSEKFNSIFDGLPLDQAFIEKLHRRLVQVIPYSLQKFASTYAPEKEFQMELRSRLGVEPYLQGKHLSFEFKDMPWLTPLRRGRRELIIHPAERVVSAYAAAIGKIKRAQGSFARLPPASDFVQTGISVLAQKREGLEDELKTFPQRFNAYAAFGSTATSSKTADKPALDQAWMDEYAENMREYANNPLEYVCSRDLSWK